MAWHLEFFHRHLHQQHLGDDVQEGQLWNWRRCPPGGHQGCSFSFFLFLFFSPLTLRFWPGVCLLVRPTVRRRLLGQQQVRHGELPAEDDEQLGHGVQCLVPAANEQRGESHSEVMKSTWSMSWESDEVFRSSFSLRAFAITSACRGVRMLCSLPTGWKQP